MADAYPAVSSILEKTVRDSSSLLTSGTMALNTVPRDSMTPSAGEGVAGEIAEAPSIRAATFVLSLTKEFPDREVSREGIVMLHETKRRIAAAIKKRPARRRLVFSGRERIWVKIFSRGFIFISTM